MATKAGKAFYTLRKIQIGANFGIIKNVNGVRCFSLRGLELVAGERGSFVWLIIFYHIVS